MKRLFLLTASIAGVVWCAFAEILPVPALTTDNVSTNATASRSATNETFLYGYVYAIDIELESAAMTCDVAIVTMTNTVGDFSTTILTLDDVSSSGRYYPRFPTHTAAGVLAGQTNSMFLLYQSRLIMQATDACATGLNMNAVIYLDTDH
ncbi:MAG: hypothetical protein JRL30_17090 [Deltaproteobacteria bacterium]|nr:hypothetical protein [Deltaproteobacteria bacterium]